METAEHATYIVMWRQKPKGKLFFKRHQPQANAEALLAKVYKGEFAWALCENENGAHKGSGVIAGEEVK